MKKLIRYILIPIVCLLGVGFYESYHYANASFPLEIHQGDASYLNDMVLKASVEYKSQLQIIYHNGNITYQDEIDYGSINIDDTTYYPAATNIVSGKYYVRANAQGINTIYNKKDNEAILTLKANDDVKEISNDDQYLYLLIENDKNVMRYVYDHEGKLLDEEELNQDVVKLDHYYIKVSNRYILYSKDVIYVYDILENKIIDTWDSELISNDEDLCDYYYRGNVLYVLEKVEDRGIILKIKGYEENKQVFDATWTILTYKQGKYEDNIVRFEVVR